MHNDKQILDELYQAYLAHVYQHVEQPLLVGKVSGSLTYGEMLYPSVKKLLNKLQIESNDIFLDLGSGLGKLALQVWMQTILKSVIGIEAREELSRQTNEVVHQIYQGFPFFWENDRHFKIITGDFLNTDWEKATIVYTCSTCFRPELLTAIGDRLNSETSVMQVLSLRALPTFTRLPLKEVFSVECSWDTALCYLYRY